MTYLCIFLYVMGMPMGFSQGVYVKSSLGYRIAFAFTWPIVSCFVFAGQVIGYKKLKESSK